MKELIKTAGSFGIRTAMRLFHLLPIKKKQVFFSAYSGHQYTCNPKYISEYLSKTYPELQLVWCYRDKPFDAAPAQSLVRYGSLSYYRAILTSGVVVMNDLQNCSYIPFRKKQTVIQTWHGSGLYKKVGRDVPNNTFWNDRRLRWTTKRIAYFISGAAAFTETVIRGAFGYDGEVKSCGLPRNDILLNAACRDEIAKKVRTRLGLKEDAHVILYAPTFRGSGDPSQQELEAERVLAACKTRFGKECVLLVRSHHTLTDRRGQAVSGTVDVSQYPDMQELICAADSMISDYSSCIWDFSLTGKPCFIFAADLTAYRVDRDFYMDVFRWPFPIALSNDELETAILQFDTNTYAENLKRHFNELGCCESGHASQTVGEDIARRCGL
ncbi:MAG: CDP-glycerol glycerophosphotransferase family protein [Clostridia bacterium]|nr:CDP-glycerol glycerophosphotransferase family protein [Clostridia bacterium]